MPGEGWKGPADNTCGMIRCILFFDIYIFLYNYFLRSNSDKKTTTDAAHGRQEGKEKKDHGLSAPWSEILCVYLFSQQAHSA